MSERLQKIISRAGIASRRKAEEYILAGRVSVNGTVVQELGSKADWTVDTIQIDGQKIEKAPEHRYLILNKPKGYITSTSDPKGRRTVMDLLGKHACRGLFPVGRLDYNTEGLLIITNDGEFANSITSARNKVPKTYQIKVNGRPAKELIDKLRRGITLDNRPIRPESIDLIRSSDNPWYELTLIQGRNRQIHRMFERIGFLIEKIRRVRIGSLTIKNMKPGEVRILKSRELQALQYSGASTHHKVPVADTPKRPTTTQTHKPPSNTKTQSRKPSSNTKPRGRQKPMRQQRKR